MPVKKEICRNFARGSCRFGQQCRFLHVNPQSAQQQQNKPSYNNIHRNTNIFSQQHQLKPHEEYGNNPYGFGVQTNSHSKGSTQTQPKAFENTWSRFSSNPAAPSSRQSESHKCTDQESCRRIIADDFLNERPLWKLTCYGHWKGAPCDIAGDISYEELRAAAYDDAKRGLGLHSIVDRERGLLNSKLVEYDNLCRPNSVLPNSNLPVQQNNAPNAFLQTPAPTSVSSFSQLGTSLNMGFESTYPAPQNNAFGQPNPFGVFSQTKNMSSESQGHTHTAVNPFEPARAPSNSVPMPTGAFGLVKSSSPHGPSIREVVVQANHKRSEETLATDSVWLKDKWSPGEVPEEAPPDAVCS